jgi:hypothetical protein
MRINITDENGILKATSVYLDEDRAEYVKELTTRWGYDAHQLWNLSTAVLSLMLDDERAMESLEA